MDKRTWKVEYQVLVQCYESIEREENDNGEEDLMKDKDGFNIKCIYSDWKIYDDRDNKDFVCTKYRCTGWHHCHADEHCKDYIPEYGNEPSGRTDW